MIRMEKPTQGPLAGLKVVEMGTLIAGPYCARLLAEFGAEVIKVETPGEGDPLRKWRKLHEGNSLWWYAQARNKKSVAVNLRDAQGQAIVRWGYPLTLAADAAAGLVVLLLLPLMKPSRPADAPAA